MTSNPPSASMNYRGTHVGGARGAFPCLPRKRGSSEITEGLAGHQRGSERFSKRQSEPLESRRQRGDVIRFTSIRWLDGNSRDRETS